jgi:hypothetical protein
MCVLVVKGCSSSLGFFDALATLSHEVASNKSTAAPGFFDLLLACKKALPEDMAHIWPGCVGVMKQRFSERAEQKVTLTAVAHVILELGLDDFHDADLFEFMQYGNRIFARNPEFFREQGHIQKPEPLNQLMKALQRKFPDEAMYSK